MPNTPRLISRPGAEATELVVEDIVLDDGDGRFYDQQGRRLDVAFELDNLSYFVPHTVEHVAPRAGRRRGPKVRGMPLDGEYEPSPQQWVRDQVELYERTDGREGNTLLDRGLPVVVFSTRGAKSGKVRKQPLMRVENGGAYLMVGSQGGAPTNPAWVANLRAAPDQVTVQDGPEPWDGVARELSGQERQEWWERAVAAFPDYAAYQEKTDRQIPIFLVERRG